MREHLCSLMSAFSSVASSEAVERAVGRYDTSHKENPHKGIPSFDERSVPVLLGYKQAAEAVRLPPAVCCFHRYP